jgi:hypothetical protein
VEPPGSSADDGPTEEELADERPTERETKQINQSETDGPSSERQL